MSGRMGEYFLFFEGGQINCEQNVVQCVTCKPLQKDLVSGEKREWSKANLKTSYWPCILLLRTACYKVPTSRVYLGLFSSMRQMMLGHNRTSLPCSLAWKRETETEIWQFWMLINSDNWLFPLELQVSSSTGMNQGQHHLAATLLSFCFLSSSSLQHFRHGQCNSLRFRIYLCTQTNNI